MEWLGRAKLDFITSPSSLKVHGTNGKPTDLLTICQETVPPCHLNPLLFNGHVQTMWTATQNPDTYGPEIYYRRKIFEADHAEFNGSFAVDFVSAPFEGGDDTLPRKIRYFKEDELAHLGSNDERPMLVIMHGLTGGSHETYLRHAIDPLIKSGKWEACVSISRGCAKSKITTGLLYNARATWDYRQLVRWLRKTYPRRPLFGLGFSMGACILVNYLGEEGSGCPLKAAVVCANPWNLDVTDKVLRSTTLGREVYLRTLGSAVKGLAFAHEGEIRKHTNIDMDKLSKGIYLYEFDRAYQCPTWGYPTEDAYYRDASSSDALLAVRVPLLCLNAADDPIASSLGLPFSEVKMNPYTVLCTTSLGGHLGWFELGGGRWHSKPVHNFFNRMAFEVDHDSIDRKSVDANIVLEAPGSEGKFSPMRRKMQVHLNT
ncbi:carboxylesterase-like protein [Xylariomycetidae sp. FL2044]|nr:carboxylesterase-like protein [Xylariomycetidae sp. FL2044]